MEAEGEDQIPRIFIAAGESRCRVSFLMYRDWSTCCGCVDSQK
jgi:hypothetical protein